MSPRLAIEIACEGLLIMVFSAAFDILKIAAPTGGKMPV